MNKSKESGTRGAEDPEQIDKKGSTVTVDPLRNAEINLALLKKQYIHEASSHFQKNEPSFSIILFLVSITQQAKAAFAAPIKLYKGPMNLYSQYFKKKKECSSLAI